MLRAAAPAEPKANAASIASRRRRGVALAILLAAIAMPALPAELSRPLYPALAVVVDVALAAVFARSLGAGREPLISTFARAERGTLEPDLVRYTRRLTFVWVGFFVLAAAVSLALAVAGASAAAFAFVAVGHSIAVALLFAGEWLFRRWRFRHYRHASPLALARIVVAHWRGGATR